MDFKSIYLDYFRNCLNEQKTISIQEMKEMAGNNIVSANNALKELWDEKIITGIPEMNIFEPRIKLDNFKKISITEEGIKKLIYNEVINEKIDDTQNNLHSGVIKQSNINSDTDIKEKYQKLQKDILIFFYKLFRDNILDNKGRKYSLYAIRGKLRELESKYFPNSGYHLQYVINDILYQNGFIIYKYGKQYVDENSKLDFKNFITQKGIDFIEKDFKENNLSSINLTENFNKPNSALFEKLVKKDSKNNNEYIFEGILGQNCGDIISPTAQDHIRIQKRGFKVKNGITVLRGFAKSSTIAECSQADNNYQRDKNLKHINALTEFMKKMKTSAKYLPEVTLVARGYNSLEPIKISGNLTNTQKGEIDNLSYYRLSIKKDQLYRIDGNHRIEAIKDENYYIPFSIIIWDGNSINEDDEAFLFYFLNSKSKKLTSEENLKGLVNAKNWTDNELQTANVILPYIKYFKENFEDHALFNKEHYKNSQGIENAKTQILNVLELILKESTTGNLSFDKKIFGDYINKTQEILSQRDRFKYLRENFRCFPQFVFYVLYKNCGSTETSIRFINEVNKWAEYYKHDYNSFIQPNKMFYNASKQLDRKINIFVAMPYYDETIVAQFNKTLRSIVEELKQEDELLNDKLNLYPIMTYKAESTDILANMDKQISECDIFIADISNHGKSKVNPNVMFELGRVYDKKKFLLIRNKDNKVTNSAFDIQHIDYIPIDYGMGFDTSMKENLKPRIMNIIKNIIGFC